MPKTVAVIGASSDRRKFGNKALRAFAQQGYIVFPINPHEREIEGPPGVRVGARRARPHRHGDGLCPAEVGVRVMDDLAAKQIAEIWLNPGADEPEVVARAGQLGPKTIQACSIIAIGETPRSF